jgi:hypothetical protein
MNQLVSALIGAVVGIVLLSLLGGFLNLKRNLKLQRYKKWQKNMKKGN